MTEAYLQAVRAAIVEKLPQARWHDACIFVPNTAAARTVHHALKSCGMGILPACVVLENIDAFALDMGVVLPPPSNPWPVRAQAAQLLQTLHPEMAMAHLIPRTEGLLQSLNLLATYEITPAALAASVPQNLRPQWELQGSALQALWVWAAPQAAAVLPSARRTEIWRGLDAALAQSGHLGPLLWWSDVPDEPPVKRVYERLLAMGMVVLNVPAVPTQVVQYKAPHPIEEMQQAVLWAAEHLAKGVAPIGIVASGAFANRVAVELEARFGIAPRTTGGVRWQETPEGEAVRFAARGWLGSSKVLSMGYWLEAVLAQIPPEAESLREALMPLTELAGRWDGASATAWLNLALEALAPRDGEDANTQDGRVHIVPPHRIVGQPFAALWVAEGVEGVWPIQAKPGALSMGQRRALGLPDAVHQAAQAHALWQAAQVQGGAVVVSASKHDESGVPLTLTRWWPQQADAYKPTYNTAQLGVAARPEALGTWQPEAAPQSLSASMLQALLACPYKAYAQRVLKLEPLPPVLPEPDPREAGKLIHSWLEAGVRHTPLVAAENAEALVTFLRAEAEHLLAEYPPLVQVVWAPRLHVLAPNVVAWWQARGTTWQPEIEMRGTLPTGEGVYAKADAISALGEIVDYKTGYPPNKAKIANGAAPQLPFEAWLAAKSGRVIESLTYVHIKGYGSKPLQEHTYTAGEFTDPVEPTVQAIMNTYYTTDAAWPAVPDPAGLGVVASGACKTCAMRGVCRREAALQ